MPPKQFPAWEKLMGDRMRTMKKRGWGNVLLLLFQPHPLNIDSALASGGELISGCGVSHFNKRKLISSPLF